MIEEKIHHGQMTKVNGVRAAIAVAFAKPSANGRKRAIADSGHVFLADVPFGVEGLGCHTELTIAVLMDQLLRLGGEGARLAR